jgi:hypothetical protein
MTDTTHSPHAPAPTPISPSWIDHWIAWVDRRRLPPWAIYSLVFVAQGLLAAGPAWLDGSTPFGRFLPLHFLAAFWTVLPLALMHHLDRYAERALWTFRPVCDANDNEIRGMQASLGTMPSRPAALAGLGGIAFLWTVFLVDPELFRPIRTSSIHFGVGMAELSLNFALLGTLLYHTGRQLLLVTRIYARATRLDLFRLSPLYAFSGLTARTGIAWAAALYLSVALFPDFLNSRLAVAFFVLQIALVLVTFAWPLLGVHGRLASEKDRALDDIGRRLTRAITELEARTDALELGHMDALNKMVTALATSRDLLAKVPTWPWSPGTPTAVLTTLLLPVGLYLVQRLLEELIGL